MIHELFNTSITIIPATHTVSNRSAVYKQAQEGSMRGIPALITSDDIGYITIDDEIAIKRGDVITNEATGAQFTVQEVFIMGDVYKLKLEDKNV
jgi:hypothetical protein